MLPKRETLYEDMIDILEELKKYVPFKTVTLSQPLVEGTTVITEDKSCVKTLLDGDYLSAAHARGAQQIRRTAELEERRLDGFLPIGTPKFVYERQVRCMFLITSMHRRVLYTPYSELARSS